MNAITSAQTLPWRHSAAFDPNLVLGDVDPVDVYEFVGRSTFDAEFRKEVVTDAQAVLARFRLPDRGRLLCPELVDDRLALDAEEMIALDELSMKVRGQGIAGARAMEGVALREGHGLPAVAALVVIVVIAVALGVFLFLYSKRAA